jgi:hypothetical protein
MELEGAVELLEDELQRILNALDPVELERALRALSDRQDAAGPSEEERP